MALWPALHGPEVGLEAFDEPVHPDLGPLEDLEPTRPPSDTKLEPAFLRDVVHEDPDGDNGRQLVVEVGHNQQAAAGHRHRPDVKIVAEDPELPNNELFELIDLEHGRLGINHLLAVTSEEEAEKEAAEKRGPREDR